MAKYLISFSMSVIKRDKAIAGTVLFSFPSSFYTAPSNFFKCARLYFPSINQGQQEDEVWLLSLPGSNHTRPATALIKTDKYRQAVNEMSGRNKALPFMPTDDTNGEENDLDLAMSPSLIRAKHKLLIICSWRARLSTVQLDYSHFTETEAGGTRLNIALNQVCRLWYEWYSVTTTRHHF